MGSIGRASIKYMTTAVDNANVMIRLAYQQRLSSRDIAVDNDFYNVGLAASWQIDLFGGVRRQVASARATVQDYDAGLQDAQVTLTMNVAMAYVNS